MGNIKMLLAAFILPTMTFLAWAQECDPVEVQKLVGTGAHSGQNFGYALAISGDRALIGVPHSFFLSAGLMRDYRFDGAEWVFHSEIIPSDGANGNPGFFGGAIAISGDIAVIGARTDAPDFGSLGSWGAAYVYRFNGSLWVEETKLIPSDTQFDQGFGWSIAISGESIVIGSPTDDVLADRDGSAYVFKYDGASWVEQTKLIASDGTGQDRFGTSVSISGNFVLVGSPEDNGQNGTVYAYEFDGVSWSEQGKVLPAGPAEFRRYGQSISVLGNRALIGAPTESGMTGAAFIFEHDGSGWVEQAKLLASDGASPDSFGWSVALSDDRAVVGAPQVGSGNGKGYLYGFNGTGWTEQGIMVASEGNFNDQFGHSIAASDDIALISAHSDSDLLFRAGSAYVFEMNCGMPCLADLNGDGILNFFDISAFLAAFTAQDPSADFDGNGLFNFFDVSAFLGAFAAGCP